MTGEVSPAGPGERPVPDSELRASHEDRDAVVEQLRAAAGDGRLTAAELDERLEQALTARTYRELAVLTTDLPATGAGGLPVPGGPVQAKDLARIQCGSGHAKRDGQWIVPRRIEVAVTSGHVKLDFTQAVITSRTLRIDADVRSGRLLLVTRPGIVVDADDVSVTSGHVKARASWGPQVTEILRIEVSGHVRSGAVIARPPRRNFLQWLRRAPRPYQSALG
jgi:Domain of unknown function (DUF1707)